MGAVTYPNKDVEQFIRQHLVPVQFNVAEQPDAMEQFNSTWTPTLIVQDADGREHRRSQGYLDAPRFLGEMALAWLKEAIDRGDFNAARDRVREVLEITKGDPEREPEARYWAAVVGYKATGDAQNLVQGWNGLIDQFPQSEWAKRAEFIKA